MHDARPAVGLLGNPASPDADDAGACTDSPSGCTPPPACETAFTHAPRRELTPLAAMAAHRGGEGACIAYRANRLAPLASNLPRTCLALGPALRDIAADYRAAYPEGDAQVVIESERFCRYVAEQIDDGWPLPPGLAQALHEESAAIAAALAESRLEAARPEA